MQKLVELAKYGLAAAAGGAYVTFVHPGLAKFVAWLAAVLN